MGGRLLWLPDYLAEYRVRFVRIPGWDTRGAATMAAGCVVCHHTASGRSGGAAPSLRICVHGRPDLPGPLCQLLGGRDAVVRLIASGRANHAGSGGWLGLVGNSSAVGIEWENDGRGEPWSSAVLDAYERTTAACLAGIAREERWACGHKEWTPRKIDPAGIAMPAHRAAAGRHLRVVPPTTKETGDVLIWRDPITGRVWWQDHAGEVHHASTGARLGDVYKAAGQPERLRAYIADRTTEPPPSEYLSALLLEPQDRVA